MVRIKRVKKTDDFIEAYYTPEDTSEEGYIRLGSTTGEDIEARLTPSDDVLKWYYRYTKRYLKRVLEGKEMLKEDRLIMWY